MLPCGVPPDDHGVKELKQFLERHGLGKYTQLLVENAIGLDVLPDLSDSDLKEIGLPLGDRKRLLMAALQLEEPARRTSELTTFPKTEAERRQLTVMFCDLVGSTALSHQLDPEDLRDVNRAYQDACKSAIERYDGFVARYMGDGVLVYFGYPQAHEDDAERAIHSGLSVIDAMSELNETFGDKLEIELGVRIGIATGLVVVGDLIGEGASQERAVVGKTPNLAARLQGMADTNKIVIASNTYDLAGRRFEYKDLGIKEVKGFPKPVRVWQVVAPSAVQSRFEARQGRTLTAFVGREPELQTLIHGWSQAKGGEGQVVLVSGEPGIIGLESPLVGRETEFRALQQVVERLQTGVGSFVTLVGEAGLGKSRLVAELQTWQSITQNLKPETRNPNWVEGRCLSFGGSIAYLLWLDVLRRLLSVTAEDPPIAVRDVLHEQVEALCPDRFDDVFPYLARLMSLPLADEVETVLNGLGSKGLKFGTFRAVQTLIESTARQRGSLVVVCEDLHWADPTSLELLEQLLSLTDQAPLLFICLFRPETEHGCWRIKETAARQYRHRHTDLWLEPLSATESERLVDNLLHVEELPPGLGQRILDHAEGNPFYVEEIIRSLIDDEAIVWDETTARWQVVGDVTEIAIPNTLHGVLMARIDRLQGETKRVLQLAAVIGRVFFYSVLEAIAQKERKLDSHLLTLQREGMIRERTRIPELEYIFKHQLTQEAAYRALLRQERRVFHHQVAEALERLFSDRVEEQLELLGHHWEQAEESEKAIEYLVRAGQKAAGRYANAEALAHFQRALALAEGQDGYDGIMALRAKVLLDMFQGREAVRDYQQLLNRTRQSGDRKGELESLLGLAAANYGIALDEPDFASKSLAWYEQAYTLAGELQDKAGMIRALISTMWFANYWPEYRKRAVANIEEARAISQEMGDEELIIDCMIARAHYDLVSIEQVEELLSRLESRHDLPRLKEAYFRLIWRHLFSGNFVRCVECCEASIKLAAKLSVPPVIYSTNKALALLGLGRYDAAWESLQEEIADEGYPFGSALKDFGTGMYLLELMAYREAATVFEDTIEQAKRVGRPWLSLWAQAELSKTLLRSERSDEVNLDWTTQDLETDIALTADVPAVLGEIALIKGNLEEALRQAEKACAEAEERGWRPVYVSALELQLRILLKLDRTGEVISLADKGAQMAEQMAYRPLVWRIRAAKAQALALLGDDGAAAQEYEAATAIILEMADAIGDSQIKHAFMSNTAVLAVFKHG